MKFKSDIEVQAGLKDSSGAAGTSGQVLSSNGTTVSWINSGIGVASYVQNQVKAGVAINKGQAVYVTGADGTNIIVGLASNATEATSSKTLGLLNATVAINGFADVIQIGKLAGLDTSTAVVGDPVWLGSNGNLIYGLANKPYAPLHLVYIGVVTRVNANNGEIFVSVQNGFELKEIHDVDIITTTPTNGDILGYNGSLWVNKTIPGWLGYTPVTNARTISTTAPLTGGGDLTANRTISMPAATTTVDGYLSAASFTIFNNKQQALNGTGFVKASGTTISYDNSTYLTSAVTTLSGGTTGLTPNTATSGAITLAGTLVLANGGTGSTTAAGARTNLGATTIGSNIFTSTNPSAINFLRANADNTVSWLDATTFRTAIGAGTGSGSVTSVSGAGGYGGLTLTGTVTTTGSLTLGGTPTGTWPISVSGNAATSTAAMATITSAASAFKIPFLNTAGNTTGNFDLLHNSTATFTYNPSTSTLTVGTVSGALSGNATTATTLQTARTIGGVSFNGSANIDLPGVNTAGNQNTSGTAAISTAATATASATASAFKIPFLNTTGVATGNFGLLHDSEATFTYNPSTNAMVVGTVTASGGFFNSDIRLKNLTNYDYNISGIKPITYSWKDGRDDKKHIGYSAQEVQKVMPDAVNEGEDGMLSVNYVEVLVAKIAELENRIKQLEK